MKYRMILGVILSVSLFLASAWADVPPLMSYQGKLTDDQGVPVPDGNYCVEFKIYDAETDGNIWWSETQDPVPVANGLFSVLLGSVNSIPDTVFERGPDRWLGMAICGEDEMTPRRRIASVGYAFKAASDNDWVLIGNVLHPVGSYGLSQRQSNVLHGIYNNTHVNFGIACTTGASGQNYPYATVSGGRNNTASGDRATVGGGYDNTASGSNATVGGGHDNIASGDRATVSGGYDNTASGDRATVGGGYDNTASDLSATVGGGAINTASDGAATVGGGYNNTASDLYATVGGGGWNTADTTYATVGGGYDNTASGSNATVSGGYDNTASGDYATVGGGYADTASGDYSFAGGRRVRIAAVADYTFAFGRDFTTSTPNAVIFHNASTEINVGIGMTNPTAILHVAQNAASDPIADQWRTYSSRRWKTNIQPIKEALEKVKGLRGVYFDWKENGEQDIGMIAEEVGEVIPEVVNYEENGRDAQSLDYARLVALLVEAVKELEQKNEALTERVKALESNN